MIATLAFDELSHIQVYWGTLRHFEVYSGITEAYWAIFRHIQNSVYCIYNRAIFRNQTYIKPEAFSKAFWTCKMTRHIQSHGIVRTLTAQKMKFSIKDFSSKCDQIRRKLQFWSDLLEKCLMENFIFGAVMQAFSRIFRDIDAYPPILVGMQLRRRRG